MLINFATPFGNGGVTDYLNYDERVDFDTNESTYHCSEFKPTPIMTGFVCSQETAYVIEENKQKAGKLTRYFLRSSVVNADADYEDINVARE